MKILVTGSTGFIGSHLFQALMRDPLALKIVGVSRKAKRYPWEINLDWLAHAGEYAEPWETINCDLTLESHVASLMLRFQPDMVFHLAGDPLVKNTGSQTSLANYMTTHHLLTHAKQGCRFVLASSATVYGDSGYPHQEYDILRPTSVYAASKAGAEYLVRAFTQIGKVRGISVRLAATVGESATHGLIPDIVRKLKSSSPTLELLGNAPGSNKPFTHISDVVDGLLKIADSDAVGPVNLALEDGLTVKEVADIVMAKTGIYKPVVWLGADANWKGDNPYVRMDSQLAKIIGWTPKFTTSREAVEHVAAGII